MMVPVFCLHTGLQWKGILIMKDEHPAIWRLLYTAHGKPHTASCFYDFVLSPHLASVAADVMRRGMDFCLGRRNCPCRSPLDFQHTTTGAMASLLGSTRHVSGPLRKPLALPV